MQKRPAVLFLDNTSADNLALALAATRRDSLLDVVAVFVTGRAAHRDPNASIEERQEIYSSQIHLFNAKRMSGFLRGAGRSDEDVPVYMGEMVYRTRLRTVIPHKFHADERLYDVHADSDYGIIAGDFRQGLQFLREYRGEKLTVLAGGPLTELAIIVRYCPDIAAKLGTIVVQAGDFAEGDSTNLLGGKGNSFNGACDPAALNDVLAYHEGDIYVLPSNITKQPEIGFATPDEMAALGIYSQLVDIYRAHYEYSAKRRGTALYVHDLGLVMLIEQLLTNNQDYPYRYEPVEIIGAHYDVPYSPDQSDRRGTILTYPKETSDRYVVTGQDTERYRERVAAYLKG